MAPRIDADLSSVTEDDMSGGGGGGDFMSIPTGEYPFIVTKSTYKTNNKGNGMVLGLQQQCLDPAIGKRVLFDHLSLANPSAEAVRIANARLKQLAIAVGHPTPDRVENSDDLHNKPYIARVVRQRADKDRLKYADEDGYENSITGYKAIDDGSRTPASDEPPPSREPIPPSYGDSGAPF